MHHKNVCLQIEKFSLILLIQGDISSFSMEIFPSATCILRIEAAEGVPSAYPLPWDASDEGWFMSGK